MRKATVWRRWLVLLEQFAAASPASDDERKYKPEHEREAIALMLTTLREEHARTVAIWFGHPDPAAQEGDAQERPIHTRLAIEPGFSKPGLADISAMLAAATHASFSAARYADVYSEALQDFSEPPATFGRVYTAADLGIARLQRTYPVQVDALVEEEPPPGARPEWPFVQRLLGHAEPTRWVWVPVEETPSAEELADAPDKLDDWLGQTLDYLRDGYWHTWQTIACLEQRIPVAPLVREITLGHLVTHEPDQRRVHSIDDSARPDVPWHEWTSRLATAMQWPQPMTPTDRIPWAMERGWLKLAVTVDYLAAGLVHPPGVTRSLDVIPRVVRESLWTQLIAYPLLYSTHEETARARPDAPITPEFSDHLVTILYNALIASTLDPGILDTVTVNHVLQKVALPHGAAERIAPHLCRTFDTADASSPIGSSHMDKLVQARVTELQGGHARDWR